MREIGLQRYQEEFNHREISQHDGSLDDEFNLGWFDVGPVLCHAHDDLDDEDGREDEFTNDVEEYYDVVLAVV